MRPVIRRSQPIRYVAIDLRIRGRGWRYMGFGKMNIRGKGAGGERQLCKWIKDNLGFEAERNLNQVRSGGSDIITYWFVFEVKRVEKLDVTAAWVQCKCDTDKVNENRLANGETNLAEPVLAYRQNRKPWSFAIRAAHIGLEKGYLLLTERTFKQWAEKIMVASDTI